MARLGREAWVKLIEEFTASGLSQRKFAEQKQVSLATLPFWIYKLRRIRRTSGLGTSAKVRYGKSTGRCPAHHANGTLVAVVGARARAEIGPGATRLSSWSIQAAAIR